MLNRRRSRSEISGASSDGDEAFYDAEEIDDAAASTVPAARTSSLAPTRITAEARNDEAAANVTMTTANTNGHTTATSTIAPLSIATTPAATQPLSPVPIRPARPASGRTPTGSVSAQTTPSAADPLPAGAPPLRPPPAVDSAPLSSAPPPSSLPLSDSFTIKNLDTGESCTIEAASTVFPEVRAAMTLKAFEENAAAKEATGVPSAATTTVTPPLSAEEHEKKATLGFMSRLKKVLHLKDRSSDLADHMPNNSVKVKTRHRSYAELTDVKLVQTITQHTGPVWSVAVSPLGDFVATGGQDSIVRVWAVMGSTAAKELDDRLRHAKAHHSSGAAAAAGTGGAAASVNYSDAHSNGGDSPHSSTNSNESYSSADVPNFEADFPKESGLRPILYPVPYRTYAGHKADVIDLAWSKANFLLSASIDKTVRLWHVSRQKCLCVFQHADFVTAVSFHPIEDRYFVSGSFDKKLRIWNIPDHRVVEWAQTSNIITAATFNPNGNMTVAGLYNGQCVFYQTDGLKYFTQVDAKNRCFLASTPLLTPTSTVSAGDVRPLDKLVGSNGHPIDILSQARDQSDEMYEVKYQLDAAKQSSHTVTPDHLVTVRWGRVPTVSLAPKSGSGRYMQLQIHAFQLTPDHTLERVTRSFHFRRTGTASGEELPAIEGVTSQTDLLPPMSASQARAFGRKWLSSAVLQGVIRPLWNGDIIDVRVDDLADWMKRDATLATAIFLPRIPNAADSQSVTEERMDEAEAVEAVRHDADLDAPVDVVSSLPPLSCESDLLASFCQQQGITCDFSPLPTSKAGLANTPMCASLRQQAASIAGKLTHWSQYAAARTEINQLCQENGHPGIVHQDIAPLIEEGGGVPRKLRSRKHLPSPPPADGDVLVGLIPHTDDGEDQWSARYNEVLLHAQAVLERGDEVDVDRKVAHGFNHLVAPDGLGGYRYQSMTQPAQVDTVYMLHNPLQPETMLNQLGGKAWPFVRLEDAWSALDLHPHDLNILLTELNPLTGTAVDSRAPRYDAVVRSSMNLALESMPTNIIAFGTDCRDRWLQDCRKLDTVVDAHHGIVDGRQFLRLEVSSWTPDEPSKEVTVWFAPLPSRRDWAAFDEVVATLASAHGLDVASSRVQQVMRQIRRRSYVTVSSITKLTDGPYEIKKISVDSPDERLALADGIVTHNSGRNRKGKKVTGMQFAPDGKTLLVTTNDSRIRLYDMDDYSMIAKFKGTENDELQIRAWFSEDGSKVICGSESHHVYVWSAAEYQTAGTANGADSQSGSVSGANGSAPAPAAQPPIAPSSKPGIKCDSSESFRAFNDTCTSAQFLPTNTIRLSAESDIDASKIRHLMIAAGYQGDIKLFENRGLRKAT